MATSFDYKKYDVSPEEATKLRQQAYEKFQRISEPALESQVQTERGALAKQAYEAGMEAARGGSRIASQDVAGKVAEKASSLMPEQFGRQDAMLQQGAQMKADIAAGKAGTQIQRFARGTEEAKNQMADYIAEKKLQQGWTSKQLALTANGYLADRGLNTLKADFEAGRVNETQMRRIENGLKYDLARMKQQLDNNKAQWQAELDVALKSRDVAKTKEILEKRITAEIDMLKTKAKASSIGSIMSGITTGASIGGSVGGPWGALIGGAAGGVSAVAVPNLINDYESGGPGADTILTGGVLDF